MNSANSSFLAQVNLPLGYPKQNYISNSRRDMDLLNLSQADLLAYQLNISSVAQNPNVLRNLGLLQQNESPERLYQSYQSRKSHQDQLAELVAMSQQTSNDLYTSRLPISSLSNIMLGGAEDFNNQLAKLTFERGLASNSNHQLNSIMQLLEVNDLQPQSQMNMNDLLLMQLNKNNFLSKNNTGHSVPPQFQNSTNFGGLLPTQSYYLNQSKGEKIPQELYPQSVEYFEQKNFHKKQPENLNTMNQRQKDDMGFMSQEQENKLLQTKQNYKNKEELKLSQNKNQKQERLQNHEDKLSTNQIQHKTHTSKPNQTTAPFEIIIQDSEDPPQIISKEQQTPMLIENTVETVDSSTISSSEIQNEFNSKKTFKCFNKFCLTDTANENLWAKEKVHNSEICKNCFNAFNQNRFCLFCVQIYHDDETAASNDDKDWIECDSCKTWNHIDCETTNNMKNLRLLLEKDNNFKYYCPNCQHNNPESTSKTHKLAKSNQNSPTQTIPESHTRKLVIQPLQHSRPVFDEDLMNEEGLREPIVKKVKLLEVSKIQIIEPQANSNKFEKDFQSDFAKKKLDNMFNKNSFQKKRNQFRNTNINEAPSYIEKLLSQYGGRRLQLSEEDVKNDLNLFKNICNKNLNLSAKNGHKDQDAKVESLYKGAFSPRKLSIVSNGQLITAGSQKNDKISKSRVQKSIWNSGKKSNHDANDGTEQNVSDSESALNGNVRTLRHRKRME